MSSTNLKEEPQKKKSVISFALVSLLIGLCFFWTGSGYLTWLYHMMDFYSADQIDLLTEVIGYIFQILGLSLFALFMKTRSTFMLKKRTFIITMFADLFFMILAVLGSNAVSTIIWGYLMNIFHGLVAGFYLTELVVSVSQQNRGIVFGIGYGVGSIGSWLLSLLNSGSFLKSSSVLFAYAILVLCTMGLLLNCKTEAQDFPADTDKTLNTKPAGNLLFLSAVTVLLLSAVKNMGFYFPTADLTNDSITLEFTRAFYAIGLIVAGFLNDKNRKFGAVLCLAALFFPFLMLLLKSNAVAGTFLWITAYVFFGFFAVYRVILFSDLAGKYPNSLYLAGFGLMWGRTGDVLGGFAGMCLKKQEVLLVTLIAVLFFFTVIVFFSLYHKIYYSTFTIPEKSREVLLQDFAQRFSFTAREAEVFKLITENCSNGEIAANLYISESTVKFHVKNILKKTQCVNRIELIAMLNHL